MENPKVRRGLRFNSTVILFIMAISTGCGHNPSNTNSFDVVNLKLENYGDLSEGGRGGVLLSDDETNSELSIANPSTLRIPGNYRWLVPLSADFSTLPLYSRAQNLESCKSKSPEDPCRTSLDEKFSPCTEDQNVWLKNNAVKNHAELAFSINNTYDVPYDFMWRNTSSTDAVMLEEATSQIEFEPSSEKFVIIECNEYPAFGIGAAAAPAASREIVVQPNSKNVTYGAKNDYESRNTSERLEGEVVDLELDPGNFSGWSPKVPVSGAGEISGNLRTNVRSNGSHKGVELNVFAGRSTVFVVPFDTPMIRMHNGSLCPEGVPLRADDSCSLSETLDGFE